MPFGFAPDFDCGNHTLLQERGGNRLEFGAAGPQRCVLDCAICVPHHELHLILPTFHALVRIGHDAELLLFWPASAVPVLEILP